MATWAEICDILHKYANRKNEMTFQKSIVDLLLKMNLGWHANQINEQLSLQLGSTERLIPDVVVTKDNQNKFVIEVKEPSHIKTQKNIDQLVSYMRQLETPIGIYVGKELEVYYKTIGDGSEPKLIMSLDFNPKDQNGDDFIELFSESKFSVEKVFDYLKAYEAKFAFDSKVNDLVAYLISPAFKAELNTILRSHFSDMEEDVVDTALEAINFDIQTALKEKQNELPDPSTSSADSASYSPYRVVRRKKGTAQRYAYGLIKQIIERNPNLGFQALFNIFGHKNHIERLEDVRDEKRWFMDEEDIIALADKTKIVISNQWGFNGHSKERMDRLRAIVEKFGIETGLP